jgi:hypothetical protein
MIETMIGLLFLCAVIFVATTGDRSDDDSKDGKDSQKKPE